MLCGGAPCPSVVWQGAHLTAKIGFTSFVYVTAPLPPLPPAPPPLPPPPSLFVVASGAQARPSAASVIAEKASVRIIDTSLSD